MWIGHAALVYATFFVMLTWLHHRLVSKGQTAKTHIGWLGVTVFLAAISVYQLLLYSTELPQLISQAGALLLYGTELPQLGKFLEWFIYNNWVTSIDFIVFTVYTVGLIIFFFGVKSLRYFLAPIIYSVALVCAFLVDAAYPNARTLQWWIYGIVFLVANLLQIFRVNVTYSKDVLYTKSGGVLVGWPCAGIHSLLIYTAVAYSFLQNLDISRLRKFIYLFLGLIGTYIVNILRIAAIIFGNYYFNWNIYMMHMYMGELFFIAWIVFFLFMVVMIERRRGKTKEAPSAK